MQIIFSKIFTNYFGDELLLDGLIASSVVTLIIWLQRDEILSI